MTDTLSLNDLREKLAQLKQLAGQEMDYGSSSDAIQNSYILTSEALPLLDAILHHHQAELPQDVVELVARAISKAVEDDEHLWPHFKAEAKAAIAAMGTETVLNKSKEQEEFGIAPEAAGLEPKCDQPVPTKMGEESLRKDEQRGNPDCLADGLSPSPANSSGYWGKSRVSDPDYIAAQKTENARLSALVDEMPSEISDVDDVAVRMIDFRFCEAYSDAVLLFDGKRGEIEAMHDAFSDLIRIVRQQNVALKVELEGAKRWADTMQQEQDCWHSMAESLNTLPMPVSGDPYDKIEDIMAEFGDNPAECLSIIGEHIGLARHYKLHPKASHYDV